MLKASREAFPGGPFTCISRTHPVIHETSAPRSLLRKRSLGSRPPRSVRVLIMRMRQMVDAMQGAMWVESIVIKNAITRVPAYIYLVPSTFRVYAIGIILVNAEHYGRAGANPKEYGNEIHCHVYIFAKFQVKTQPYILSYNNLLYMYNNIIP